MSKKTQGTYLIILLSPSRDSICIIFDKLMHVEFVSTVLKIYNTGAGCKCDTHSCVFQSYSFHISVISVHFFSDRVRPYNSLILSMG